MPPWHDIHHTRAEEFLRLLGDAIAPVAGEPRAVATRAAPAPAPRAEPPAPLVTPPAAAPTAASVFKKIPWKK